MPQYGWIFDESKCVGCRACTVACQMENNLAPEMHWRWVIERTSGAYPTPQIRFVSMACYHCAQPACMASCPVDAITKDADTGIVLIDQDACIGCRYCMAACPYGAPQYNPDTGKVEKCVLCIQRTKDKGLEPACARTCVGGAIQFAIDADWGGPAPEGFSPRQHTNPSVKFVG